MEWVVGTIVLIMLGLYAWASRTANRAVRKRIQPIIDDAFGTPPKDGKKESLQEQKAP